MTFTRTEVITDTGAAAAIASPVWLPALHEISEIAALILPILGVLWFTLQISLRLYAAYRGKVRHK